MRVWVAVFIVFGLVACSPGGPGSPSTGRETPPPSSEDRSPEGFVSTDAGTMPPSGERCGDGLDDDMDGAIDEGCVCAVGETQPCHTDRSIAGVGGCVFGTHTCAEADEFGGAWGACEGAVGPVGEVCDDGVDDDCDGAVDEGCPDVPEIVEVAVSLDGDCLTASCPAEAPYPVGCNIMMDGGDHRGCVASSPTNSVVYFQEGDACGAGRVRGTLSCSSEPGAGLNEGNCVINKPTRYYPADRSGCPDT